MNVDRLVVGLAGMPGAGKSLVVKSAQDEGYDVVTMGDVVREETMKRGLELNPINVGNVMLELRTTSGDSIIAEKCVPRIEMKQSARIVVDGLRSYIEAEAFQRHFAKFVLVAVHAAPQVRFARLSSRGRSDDPKTWEVFRERDMRELGVGVGNAIAMAEHLIINDDSADMLKKRTLEVLRRVEEKWTK
ncbi:MAG: AAA family ATPase [Candidatus Bathyarchaeia archaeon]